MDWRRDDAPLAGRPETRLRDAAPADLPTIVDIEASAHLSPWSEKIFAGEFDLDWSYLWLATIDVDGQHEAFGFVVFWAVHDEIHLLNIAVAPRFQRRGLGRLLLDELVRSAQDNGYSFITLEVRVSNTAAIALYETSGFVVLGERDGYYADTGEAAMVMTKILDDDRE